MSQPVPATVRTADPPVLVALPADPQANRTPAPAGGAIPGPPGLGYLPPLDGLRGLAILLVMFCHFGFRAENQSRAAVWWHRLTFPGWAGVDLFFVLSGFLITRILLQERGRPGYFRTFYVRRSLRIFPLYYGVLIFVYFVAPLLSRHSMVPAGSGFWTPWVYLQNIWIALGHNVIRLGNFYIIHFWSLCVEEQFYLVWPAVVAFSGRGLSKVCGGAIATAFLCRTAGLWWHPDGYDFVFHFTLCRMDSLAVGALLAVAGQTASGRARLVRTARPLLPAAAGLFAVLFAMYPGLDFNVHPRMLPIALTLTPVLGGCITALAAFSGAGKLIAARPLVLLGRYSYGVYVFHFLFYEQFSRFFYFPFDNAKFPLLPTLTLTAFGMTATILFAAASYHFYELPILRLKRFFVYK